MYEFFILVRKLKPILVRTQYPSGYTTIRSILVTTRACNKYSMKFRHFMLSHLIRSWIRVSQSQFVPCSHPSLVQHFRYFTYPTPSFVQSSDSQYRLTIWTQCHRTTSTNNGLVSQIQMESRTTLLGCCVGVRCEAATSSHCSWKGCSGPNLHGITISE